MTFLEWRLNRCVSCLQGHRSERGNNNMGTPTAQDEGHRLRVWTEPTIVPEGRFRRHRTLDHCKGGVCCSCRARALEGEVKMDKNYPLETHEIEAGAVLTCQCYPVSERVVISCAER